MIDWDGFNDDEPLSFDDHVSGIEDQLDRNEHHRLTAHYEADDDEDDYDVTTTP